MGKIQMKIRFLINMRETRTLFKQRKPGAIGKLTEPVVVTSSSEPLLTIILDGVENEGS